MIVALVIYALMSYALVFKLKITSSGDIRNGGQTNLLIASTGARETGRRDSA